MIEQSDLARVDILVLIDQHMVICASDRLPVGGVFRHRLDDEWHHVGKVDRTGLAKCALVDAEIFDGLGQYFVIGVDIGRKRLESSMRSLAPPIMSRMSASSFQYIRRSKKTRRCSGASQSGNWSRRPAIAGLRFRRRNAKA